MNMAYFWSRGSGRGGGGGVGKGRGLEGETVKMPFLAKMEQPSLHDMPLQKGFRNSGTSNRTSTASLS